MTDEEVLVRSCARRGQVIGNNYVLEDILGMGGMGVVHLATQRSLERTVAIKVPRPDLVNDDAVRQQFRNEAIAGSRINHRNIVSMLDFGVDDGVPYLVMEHIVGPRLSQLLDETGTLPIATAVDLVRQIVAGLEDAHGNGVVHADVKCDNVLVQTQRDGSLLPRLIDFGIARFGDNPAGMGPLVSGTPEYVAPEVAGGQRPTPAADVYALGVMLYELVTGVPPFEGETARVIMSRKLEADATPMRVRCPELDVPRELDRLVQRMLARDPAMRPIDAHELARCLELARATSAGAAQPPVRPSPVTFSTETTTTTMTPDVGSRTIKTPRPSPADHRLRVITEIRSGNVDRIAAAYLDLAQMLIDRHDMVAAQRELEEGVELLMTPIGRGPLWRLLLSLATLYEHHGDRIKARLAARAARDHAVETNSSVGRERSERLCARLR